MAKWGSFVRRHHLAIVLGIVAVLVMLPARHTGPARYRFFSHDIDIPVIGLLLASLVIGVVIGALLASSVGGGRRKRKE